MSDEQKPRRRGRPQWEPSPRDRTQVKMMSAMGLTSIEIAAIMGVNFKTLEKHCQPELSQGAPEACAKVALSLYRMATDPVKPNVVAAIFFLKARAGWREADSVVLKKELAQERARTADDDTHWAGLLQ